MNATPSRPVLVRPLSRSGFDPQRQPLAPVPALAPLLPQALELDFIRQALQQPFDWQVEPLFLDEFDSAILALPDVARAAVLMPLVQRNDGLHVIFTRRADHLSNHAGQVSFPGGRIEPQDADAVAAALRETHEEIGIAPEFLQPIGTQPSLLTASRFIMTPVVGVLRPGYLIQPNHDEVAEVFDVPLRVLMDPASYRLHRVDFTDGAHRLYFSISWQSHFIWGATATLLRNFHRFLLAAQARHQ